MILEEKTGISIDEMKVIYGEEAVDMSDEQLEALGILLYDLCYSHTKQFLKDKLIHK